MAKKNKKKDKNKTFVIESEYEIYYHTGVAVPIPEIVASLQSIERLIHRSSPFLDAGLKGVKVVELNVFVDTLQAGSLREKFTVKCLFKTDEDYEQFQNVVDKLIRNSDMVKYLIAAGVGASIAYGAGLLAGSSAPTTHIEAYNNTIINIGAEVELSSDDIHAILNKTKNKKQLAQDTVAIIKPAKNDPDAKITMSEIDELTINKELVHEIPSEYVPPEPESKDEDYKNVDVVIFASDKERSASNWAGIIPEIVDKRTRIVLEDGVAPQDIHGRLRIKADVTVTSKYNKSKKLYEPSVITIAKSN